MATTTMQAPPTITGHSFKPLITRSTTACDSENTKFDPNVHLAFEAPEQTIMMKDIGYGENVGVSPVAASQPFPLFTASAVATFRDQVLQPEVMEQCRYSGTLGACYLRGYASKYAPFLVDAWNHPETLAIISKIAGVDLVPNMEFELGHINVSVKSDEEAQNELEADDQAKKEANSTGRTSIEDDKPIISWHHDSYPFVCVTMLSDCSGMIGGETVLRTGGGGTIKVRGPQMGYSVVLQGRYITHQALRALGARERITMVTSFRPKSPYLADDSDLSTVRGISDLSELYFQFASYRLEILEKRVQAQLEALRANHSDGKKTMTKQLKAFLDDQENFLQHTNSEIIPDELVIVGHQPQLQLVDVGGH